MFICPASVSSRTRLTLLTASLLLGLAGPTPAQAPGSPELLVSGYTSASVHRYDRASGGVIGTLGAAGSVDGAQSATFGPDGHLYVCAEEDDEVLRYSGVDGSFLGAFVFDDPNTPGDETGGLTAPTAATFGPDGHLYVCSFDGDDVRRYDGSTGAFLGIFVSAGSGGLNGPDAGMTFGPDGHLYVPSFYSDQVLRYHGGSGAFLGVFVAPSPGSLSRPRMLRFRSDGMLYVTSWLNNRINRYDRNGNFVDRFINVSRPSGFAIDPSNADLYVTSDSADDVKVFDGLTGASKGTRVAAGAGGLDAGTFVEFFPDQELRLGRLEPGIAGAVNSLHISNGSPSSLAVLLFGTSGASLGGGGCPGTPLGVGSPALILFATDGSGDADLSGNTAAALAGMTFFIQAYQPSSCRVSNLVVTTLQ